MKINVEFTGLPMVSDIVREKKLELDLSGDTVRDVVDELIERYGEKVGQAFYDAQGNFDPMIQIALNEKSFIPSDKHDTPLNEGDSLIFVILLAGG